MARYAVDLLTNDAKRALFAAACRKRAVEMFDAAKVVDQYESYYEQILSEKLVSIK
jgi:glycosyltransferase involved in cell wall biosynthesis